MWNPFNLCDSIVSIESRGSHRVKKNPFHQRRSLTDRWILHKFSTIKNSLGMSWDSQKDYLLFHMFRTLEKETSCLVLMVTMTLVWHFWQFYNPFYDDNLWFKYVMVVIANGLKQDIRLNVTAFQECLMYQFQIIQIRNVDINILQWNKPATT